MSPTASPDATHVVLPLLAALLEELRRLRVLVALLPLGATRPLTLLELALELLGLLDLAWPGQRDQSADADTPCSKALWSGRLRESVGGSLSLMSSARA